MGASWDAWEDSKHESIKLKDDGVLGELAAFQRIELAGQMKLNRDVLPSHPEKEH